MKESISQRKRRLLAECDVYGYVVPGRQEERVSCKALARKGVLIPNGCLGYRRPTPNVLQGVAMFRAWVLIGVRISISETDGGVIAEMPDCHGMEPVHLTWNDINANLDVAALVLIGGTS